jgi:signal transduction histidine kinase
VAIVPPSRTGPPPGAGQHAWDRFAFWWNASFVLAVLATVGLAVAEVHDLVSLAILLALYAGWSLLYALTLGQWTGSCGGSKRSRLFYLATAFAIFTAACFVFPGSALLLFVLVPHCFCLLSLRPAVVAVVGLVLVNAGAELAHNGINMATVIAISVSGALTLLLSIFLGAYIESIIGQSRRRALLIEELERTRGELAEVSHDKGALAERERLAREIHDALAQGFTSVIMLVQAAQAALDRGETGYAQRQLFLAEGAARDGLSEARSLIAALGPLPLQGDSLAGAVARVCQDSGARFGFVVRFGVEGEPGQLSKNAEIVLLRVAQEALANVGRHAGAETASVSLTFDENITSLEVTDDGVGFDAAHSAGFGLSQLRSRVDELGGTTEVSSVAGEGTKVRVVLPTGACVTEAGAAAPPGPMDQPNARQLAPQKRPGPGAVRPSLSEAAPSKAAPCETGPSETGRVETGRVEEAAG